MFHKSYLPFITLTITLFWLIFTSYFNEIPPDTGDGIMHFYISQASWSNPELFLDHWGKPLFILLSSPFAQLGFSGIIFFQLLTYFLTCFFSFKILKKLEVSPFLICLFPFFLVLTSEYTNTILSALTEPLFNLFIVVASWLLLNKKWILFTIVLSFTPYLRSEGQLCILIALFILLVYKQIKYLPFILTGFIIYSTLGLLIFDDFWWYFNKSPYSLNNDIYGNGSWTHYLQSYKNYIGNHGLILFILAIIVSIYYKTYTKLTKHNLTFIFYCYSLFFIPLIIHSYFFATGQNASYGLTRIATQGMPLFLIVNLFLVSQGTFETKWNVKNQVLFSCLLLIFTLSLVFSKKWPIKAKKMDLEIIHACKYIKENSFNNSKIFYHHPLIGFKLNTNPFIKNTKVIHYYGQDITDHLDAYILPGDLLVWDSHFGDVEAGMPLEKIMNLKGMKLKKKFVLKENNVFEGIYIFQYKKRSNN